MKQEYSSFYPFMSGKGAIFAKTRIWRGRGKSAYGREAIFESTSIHRMAACARMEANSGGTSETQIKIREQPAGIRRTAPVGA